MHRVKLDAFLDRFGAAAPVRGLVAGLERRSAGPAGPAGDWIPGASRAELARTRACSRQRDLATQLLDFVADSG